MQINRKSNTLSPGKRKGGDNNILSNRKIMMSARNTHQVTHS
jgi:hypothetical protein